MLAFCCVAGANVSGVFVCAGPYSVGSVTLFARSSNLPKCARCAIVQAISYITDSTVDIGDDLYTVRDLLSSVVFYLREKQRSSK